MIMSWVLTRRCRSAHQESVNMAMQATPVAMKLQSLQPLCLITCAHHQLQLSQHRLFLPVTHLSHAPNNAFGNPD